MSGTHQPMSRAETGQRAGLSLADKRMLREAFVANRQRHGLPTGLEDDPLHIRHALAEILRRFEAEPNGGADDIAGQGINVGEQWTLTLTAVPGWSTPGTQRIRAALKSLIRSYGLKCIAIREGSDK